MPSSADSGVVGAVRARVSNWLERLGLARSRSRLVVGVSGGADSLCLLDVLVSVLPDAHRRLIVGHVDHRLRSDSADDAAHVRQVAARLGLRAEVVVADVPAAMRAAGEGLEATARRLRYAALAALAGRGARPVACTGHTRDDLVETVLLHLIRGSGLAGLGGIRVLEQLEIAGTDARDLTRLTLVRPMLAVTRAETIAYCTARDLPWLVDPTNADPTFARNRVRHHLLPVLRTYNPAIDEALDRLARVVADDDDRLEQAVDRSYPRLVRTTGGRPTVRIDAWRRQGRAMRRRLVRRIGAGLGRSDLSFASVERALAVGEPDGPPRAELGGGLVVTRVGAQLRFEVT